ncbi:MAG: hypothetical protein M0P64_03915 [Candidatus Pacebacteria bacterium]|jgi:hypothetical protein|nr:hypothetical protein [Candidatus Paceibacterota bacterium]
MKNKILILIILALAIPLAVFLNFKNQQFVFDSSSKNIGVFLEGDVTNYYKTDDKNIKYFIKNILAKPVPGNAPEDSKYLQFGVAYYNQNQFLAQQSGADYIYFDLYNSRTGENLSKSCYINKSEGYLREGNVLSSVYPLHRTTDYSEQNICLYELGNNNFTLIKLNNYLKNDETFVKNINNHSYNSTPLYDYTINTEKRIITLSVFDNTSKDSDGNYRYTRSVEVSY